MRAKNPKPFTLRLRQYLLLGLIVSLPLWVTWLALIFLFRLILSLGGPWVEVVANALAGVAPGLSRWLLLPLVQTLVTVLLLLMVLYLLGWATTRVVGRRLLAMVDRLMERVPLVQTIYGSTRKLLAVLQEKPKTLQRVVLIDFPSPEMKTVGFVTRTMTDEATGQELAAVYVPTTPNPTSGYLEIVPMANVVATDWTFNDAMAFIISGGAVGPEKMYYSKGKAPSAS